MKIPIFWGLNARPPKPFKIFLAALPFFLFLIIYLGASHYRHIENPKDKILPTFGQMKDAVVRLAFEKDPKTEKYLMLNDTLSSLRRLFLGIIIAAFFGLLIGINMGLFPGYDSLYATFITVISIIPPLAILPILFIMLGVDEFAKVALIFLGTFPLMCRDIYLYTQKIPQEQVTKSLTLGASSFQVTYKIIMPQVMPRLINSARLSFGAAWLFLIASEAIASTNGLGYRIFLVRRYLAMDIIIPYVIWITILGYFIDWLLKKIVSTKYKWYEGQK